MKYNRCGRSGVLLPAISLGLWHNFGSVDVFSTAEAIIKTAFDKGITHFDLANNYGPVPGSAEENFGKIVSRNFNGFLRDQLFISTKAGYTMWDGPYGDWGSRKYLISSLDQSLKRMNLDYVDVFYSHRPDPETPIEETMQALDFAVRSGRALYAGISNYSAEQTQQAANILRELGTPCLIHQPKYSMFVRWTEEGLLDVLEDNGIGCIAFSPLAQGLLTDRYLKGIPENSRAAKSHGFLQKNDITEERLQQITALNNLAQEREQTLAQMAIAWLLKDNRVTSVLVGASSVEQLQQNLESINNLDFSQNELQQIEEILKTK
ncbi:L-glyceraldehyde 3-phosphate reductase [Elizabethkingia bruuniana]|uniref:L-glyceraldehyde 3-phosphate reductase n=1 Tax=Elizabethkingia bruuniana TaxID=1756149 RepID=A0A7T7UW33_9FLAO|nr:L-glyceraldehyde 3-phosphate reductase [Elizabethkingia bruuniana]KGO08768.1 L-glyceraldehyde 3-phosphate reductase [Elizabethkingia miricola]AQX83876.1 L-glyceraldehyde 3-phosphate reductase [Elizabethkingia bruuniana]KUY28127.1 L-glyceraldehyde 3-phosphate reductase [Elizabethkingia bruuniana]OPB64295.1 L-glyceraldehyde 3-phosphate reductase [Elizabethkingia bruuniana]QDZ63418.1 L-glyceraldehyde 3-phosphate reductase [Elizabethkingia bruuniana]